MPNPIAYSYVRFSTPEQAQGDSHRRQTEAAEDYALRHGLTLDRSLTLKDLGVSAFRGRNAEVGALADFLQAIRDGLVPPRSVLLVESLDRVSRQTARKALRTLEDIVDLGVDVVTLSDGRRYSKESLDNDPTALLMSILIFMRANEESAMKARRLSAAWSNKRRAAAEDEGAKIMTSRCPAWMEAKEDRSGFKLIPERAKIVRRVFKEAAKGAGEEAIATMLNQERVPVFGDGARWHKSYVAKMLRNPAAVGRLVPMTSTFADGRRVRTAAGDPIEGYYPAAIEAPLWSRVVALKSSSNSRPTTKRSNGVVNVLAGLARCSKCGASMTLVNKGAPPKGARYLVCSAAKVGAAKHYEATRLEIFEGAILGSGSAITRGAPKGVEREAEIRDELEAIDQKLDAALDQARELADEIAEGNRSVAVREKLAEVEQEIEELRAQERELGGRLEAAAGPGLKLRLSELREALDAEAVDKVAANAALRAVLERVVIDRKAKSLTLHWRHGGKSEFALTDAEW